MDNQNNRNKQNLPGNNNPNNKNNRQRWNVILFTVMLISFIVFALYQFREDTDAREITYDQFLNMVDSGEVKKVVIEDDKIVITAKTEAEMKNSKKKGASESDVVEGSVADNNDSSSKDSSDDSTGLFSNVTRKQYYTGIVKDDTLSDRLYKAGVEYEQKIPDSTSYMVMNLLVNIVPLVIMIGLLGAEVYLHFDYEGATMTARVDSRTTARTGDTVTFAFDAEKIHVFDKETEKTITN